MANISFPNFSEGNKNCCLAFGMFVSLQNIIITKTGQSNIISNNTASYRLENGNLLIRKKHLQYCEIGHDGSRDDFTWNYSEVQSKWKFISYFIK